MSAITQKYKKRAIWLTILSWLLCFGTAIALIIIAVNRYSGNESEVMLELSGRFGDKAQEYLEKIKTIMMTSLVSMVPMVILSIIVKDKIRPLI